MKQRSTLTLLGVLLLLSAMSRQVALAADNLSPTEAANHVGETAKVCGLIAGAKYATQVKGQPTFVNFEKDYPNQVFTALVWGNDRRHFSPPPESLVGKQVCVSGKIESYKDRPEIIVSSPGQFSDN